MQSLHSASGFANYPKPQSGNVYQRYLGLPLPMLSKQLLDFPDFPESEKNAPSREDLQRHRPSLQMHSGPSYSPDPGPTYAHHQTQPPYPSVSFPVMAPAQRSPPVYSTGYVSRQDSQSTFAEDNFGHQQPVAGVAAKQFPCSTCTKRFARRSDLARHERIHTGVRPHACDWPTCDKAFIQRSALTVHMRVHTREKPHLCSQCSKPFSDSSSLARHRRTHSGKRPYKCEFANCQKTFTRRTTLTRHQNHHVGTTLEQAAAEVSAALKSAQPQNSSRYVSTSDSSPSGTMQGSPPSRPLSGSSHTELPPMVMGMQRQNSDYGFPSQQLPIPVHLRGDFQQNTARSTSPLGGYPLHTYTSAPQPQRSSTSYPSPYGPPQPMEPPANGTGSGAASPHLGWNSPSHSSTLPPPFATENSTYSESGLTSHSLGGHQINTLLGSHQLYYPSNGLGRPQSTEPKDYGLQHHQPQMPSQIQLSAEWNQLPQVAQDNRPANYGMWRHGLPDRQVVGDDHGLSNR